jgi:hypothetical protein
VRGGRDHRAPQKRVRERCYVAGAWGEREGVIYRVATSLDGFIADNANSLAWLFAVEHDDAQQAQHEQFLRRIGVPVEGPPPTRGSR